MSKKEKDLVSLNLPVTGNTDDNPTDDKKDSTDKDPNKDKDKDKDKDDDELMYPIFLPGLGGLSLDEDESKE